MMQRQADKNDEYVYIGKPLVLGDGCIKNVTYVNRRFIEASGYSKEEADWCTPLYAYAS